LTRYYWGVVGFVTSEMRMLDLGGRANHKASTNKTCRLLGLRVVFLRARPWLL
jgi:hypothetical protein